MIGPSEVAMAGQFDVVGVLGYSSGITEAGVFMLHFVVAAVLTVLVMSRVGAGRLRAGFLLGVVGAAFVLVSELVFGPMVIALTISQFKAVVIAAAAGTAVGVSLVVVLVRPQESRRMSIGQQEIQADSEKDPEFEL